MSPPAGSDGRPTPESGTGPPPPPPGPPPSRDTAPPRRRRTADGPVLGWGFALIAGGVLWLLALADVPVPWDLVLPVAVLVTGLLVLVLGRRGGTGGLVGFGVVLAVVALGASIGGVPWALSAGERVHAPEAVTDLQDGYELGAGTLTIDLRDLDPSDIDGEELRASVSMGELVVRLPAEVELSGRVRAGMGEVEVGDRSRSGVAPSLRLTAPEDVAAVVLDLDLQVGLGRVEVTR